jgi:thiamine-monophosphate kinase
VVVVTGDLGAAAAALLEPEADPALRARQLTPTPRLEAGRTLAEAGATAMIDISDGLAADAEHLAEASGVAIEIEADGLPVAPGVAEVAARAGVAVLELVAGGGEDYELLATLPPEVLDRARSGLGELGLTEIGRVVTGAGVSFSGPDGALKSPSGFDQRRHWQAPSDNA